MGRLSDGGLALGHSIVIWRGQGAGGREIRASGQGGSRESAALCLPGLPKQWH